MKVHSLKKVLEKLYLNKTVEVFVDADGNDQARARRRNADAKAYRKPEKILGFTSPKTLKCVEILSAVGDNYEMFGLSLVDPKYSEDSYILTFEPEEDND